MAKKIVFGSLKYGVIHSTIKPIVPYLAANGYEVIFLHGNSVSSKLKVVQIPGVTQIDVGEGSFRKHLKYLASAKADVFVSLGYKSLFDIMYRQMAESLRAKAIYMEHGLFIIGVGDSFHFRLTESVPRYIKLCSLYLTFLSLNLRHSLKYLTLCLKAMVAGNYQKLLHDAALFYTKKGAELLAEFKFMPGQLYFSGYPLVSESALVEGLSEKRKVLEYVVFLHQPVIADKVVTISYEEEKSFLLTVAEGYQRLGLQFILKLHPRESIELYAEMYKNSGIVVSNGDLLTIVKDAKYVISQFSTALFLGVLLNIPIFINKYPTLNDSYLDIFRNLALINPSVEDIGRINGSYDSYLNDISDTYKSFQENYIGYNNSFEHQAKELCTIIENLN